MAQGDGSQTGNGLTDHKPSPLPSEGRGHKFESCRARHLVLVCEHHRLAVLARENSLFEQVLVSFDTHLVVVNFDDVDKRPEGTPSGTAPIRR